MKSIADLLVFSGIALFGYALWLAWEPLALAYLAGWLVLLGIAVGGKGAEIPPEKAENDALDRAN